jgi:hypothetical protein
VTPTAAASYIATQTPINFFIVLIIYSVPASFGTLASPPSR